MKRCEDCGREFDDEVCEPRSRCLDCLTVELAEMSEDEFDMALRILQDEERTQ